jgi:two-component system NtrC family sensor kinase
MRSILKPLAALREGVLRVAGGDLSTRIHLPGRDEFAQLAASFNQMTAQAARYQKDRVRSQKLASIGQIAAGVAHEINNPLGVILGYVKLMQKEPNRVTKDDLQIIEDEAHQCQRIVQGLLDLARPMQLEMSEVNLAELARDSIERLKETGKLNDIDIEQVGTDIHVMTWGDEVKLRQAFLNVVLNAVEATPVGGKVIIETAVVKGEAVLSITDTGTGMTPEVLSHIFGPFFTTKPKGMGLGLATVQAIIDAHDGNIDVFSEPGQGTCILLRLPGLPYAHKASAREAGDENRPYDPPTNTRR